MPTHVDAPRQPRMNVRGARHSSLADKAVASGIAMIASLEGVVDVLNTHESRAFESATKVVDRAHLKAVKYAFAYTGLDEKYEVTGAGLEGNARLGMVLARRLVTLSNYHENGLTVEAVRARVAEAEAGGYLEMLDMFIAVKDQDLPYEYLAELIHD